MATWLAACSQWLPVMCMGVNYTHTHMDEVFSDNNLHFDRPSSLERKGISKFVSTFGNKLGLRNRTHTRYSQTRLAVGSFHALGFGSSYPGIRFDELMFFPILITTRKTFRTKGLRIKSCLQGDKQAALRPWHGLSAEFKLRWMCVCVCVCVLWHKKPIWPSSVVDKALEESRVNGEREREGTYSRLHIENKKQLGNIMKDKKWKKFNELASYRIWQILFQMMTKWTFFRW